MSLQALLDFSPDIDSLNIRTAGHINRAALEEYLSLIQNNHAFDERHQMLEFVINQDKVTAMLNRLIKAEVSSHSTSVNPENGSSERIIYG